MNIDMKPGKYIVAVSGGVDSMVLLDLLAEKPGLKLTVAHFDHGMRPESREDRLFVRQKSQDYGLPFVYEEGRLGPKAGEAAARRARYGFLDKVRLAADAEAVATAHHQDDVLETAIINLLRGTGRKGLTSLASSGIRARPLLDFSKQQIREYALRRGLEWREDASNADPSYLRNHIRHKLLPRFDAADRRRLLDIIAVMRKVNSELDEELEACLELVSDQGRLRQREFVMLPHSLSLELMAIWLRNSGIGDFDRKTLERLAQTAKIKGAGSRADIAHGVWMEVDGELLALKGPER